MSNFTTPHYVHPAMCSNLVAKRTITSIRIYTTDGSTVGPVVHLSGSRLYRALRVMTHAEVVAEGRTIRVTPCSKGGKGFEYRYKDTLLATCPYFHQGLAYALRAYKLRWSKEALVAHREAC